jgi:hypothetical protein
VPESVWAQAPLWVLPHSVQTAPVVHLQRYLRRGWHCSLGGQSSVVVRDD